MHSLEVINHLNRKLAEEYFRNTPPRKRLENRLNALTITNELQNKAILEFFDSLPEGNHEEFSNFDVETLLWWVKNIRKVA